MRPTPLLALSLVAALGCEGTAAQTSDLPPTDRPPADTGSERPDDVAPADSVDASVDAAVDRLDASDDLADAADISDASDAQGPCLLDIPPPDTAGANFGYLRFANFGRGLGTLRFVARNLPQFSEAFVEAIVPEGTATEHIRTLPVAYEIHVTPAPDAAAGHSVDASTGDGGMFTDGPSAPPTMCTADAGPGEVVAPTCTDVYFIAGCTIVLAGSREGSVEQQRDRRLWRLSDVPARTNDCRYGRVRALSWFAEGAAIDIDGPDGAPIARNAAYHETTGYRSALAGPFRVIVRNNETAEALGTFAAGDLTPGHTHTLHVWGDARHPTNRGVNALLLNDVTPPFR